MDIDYRSAIVVAESILDERMLQSGFVKAVRKESGYTSPPVCNSRAAI